MALSPKVRLKNGRRLVRKLRNIPVQLRSDLERVIEEGARAVASEIATRAPVSTIAREHGHLRDEIQWKVSNDGLRARIGFFGARYRKWFFYARFLEFGTKKMRKRPFVGPAFLVHGRQILRDIETKTDDVLLRVAASSPPDT